MSPEKPPDSKVNSVTARNAEMIASRLSDYLSVRFDHASRISPNLKLIKQDLTFHEMANVRRALLGEKLYGPIRLIVADVFLGDDEKRRRGLMSPTDQTSIQVELVSHCQDERVEATRGQIRIHDLKTFYASIDGNLNNMMDLIEAWIWWDIQDAAELVRFEQKLGLISLVRQGRLADDARRRYASLVHPATDEGTASAVTDEEVIRYEIRQLLIIRDQWANRRQSERGYMYVLKREELQPANQGELIHQVAAKVREYDAIESSPEISEEARHRHAPDLRLSPDKVTREAVLEFLQNQLITIEREMLHQADRDVQLGPPFNYKERQLDQMDKWLHDLNQQMRGIVKAVAPPPPAPAAPPPPATQ